MNFLETHNVVKRFGAYRALDNVSIAVRQGTIFGLLGPNGAGKTTLIRIINRITAPDEGEVLFDGHPFDPKDITRIGYLPEERGLYRKMKVGEQAVYLAKLKGINGKTAQKRLKEWFEKFEIQSWWNKKVEELSKGMQQKVQFICTVIHEPELLILDEPFSGFDPINAELLKKEILEMKEAGRTIIFSTHNMQSVEEICDDIALVNKGQIVLSGNVDAVRSRFNKGVVSMTVSVDSPLTPEELAPFTIVESFYEGGKQRLRVERALEQTNRKLPTLLPERARLLSLQDEIPSMNDIFIHTIQSMQENESKN